MMTIKVEFFYDYVSVYSYLANSQLDTIAGAEIEYRPMLLGAVMEATDNRPPLTVKAKGRYLIGDVARWVSRYGLSFKFNPVFPQNTVNALRVAIVALREQQFDAIHQSLFDAMWIDEVNLSDKASLASLITDAGLDAGAYLDAIGRQEVKDELKANTDEAIERGAFGAPTFFVGDQMFFGNDRFDFIKEEIANQSTK